MDWERVAAQPGPPAVSQLLHGVSRRRTDAGPPHQERSQSAPEDGGQLPPVSALLWECFFLGVLLALGVQCLHVEQRMGELE